MQTYDLRKDFVVDNLLRQLVDDKRQAVQQANPNGAVRVAKYSDNKGNHLGFKVVLRQFGRNLEHNSNGLGPTTAEFNRLHQLREDLHDEEVFRKVV